jgi:hypothetical protein
MILVNWPRRASEEPHSSTAPGPLVEALFLLWSVSMSSYVPYRTASYAAPVWWFDFEAYGLEVRFWAVEPN